MAHGSYLLGSSLAARKFTCFPATEEVQFRAGLRDRPFCPGPKSGVCGLCGLVVDITGASLRHDYHRDHSPRRQPA
jgi:hypothetical protein